MSITIYADGSCLSNGKENSKGGFGVVAYDKNYNIIHAYSEFKETTTNNEQEILAILYAYEHFGEMVNLDSDFVFYDPPIVYSDSAYCVNTFNDWMFKWASNGWIKSDKKEPKNLNLIKKYYKLYEDGLRIDLRLVKGHVGNEGNEIADKLATGKLKPEDLMK